MCVWMCLGSMVDYCFLIIVHVAMWNCLTMYAPMKVEIKVDCRIQIFDKKSKFTKKLSVVVESRKRCALTDVSGRRPVVKVKKEAEHGTKRREITFYNDVTECSSSKHVKTNKRTKEDGWIMRKEAK